MFSNSNMIQDKFITAFVILVVNLFGRDVFDNFKEKCTNLCKKYIDEDLLSFLLVIAIVYLYTKDIQTSIIGGVLYLGIDQII